MRITAKVMPLLFLIFGGLLLMATSLPILKYKIWEIQFIEGPELLISPQVSHQKVLGVKVSPTTNNFPAFESSLRRDQPLSFGEFIIQVPRLRIEEARVFVDSNDLTQGLAHLSGSALPGERGNVFISGHSALPIVFNGEKNYGAIFANLHELKKGDQIKVKVLGSQFTYQVLGIRLVDPHDLSVILPPDSDGRYISLMTCVPPGLNTKRLVVLGKLI